MLDAAKDKILIVTVFVAAQNSFQAHIKFPGSRKSRKRAGPHAEMRVKAAPGRFSFRFTLAKRNRLCAKVSDHSIQPGLKFMSFFSDISVQLLETFY